MIPGTATAILNGDAGKGILLRRRGVLVWLWNRQSEAYYRGNSGYPGRGPYPLRLAAAMVGWRA